ncbi:amidase domain-containing protein [Herbihabitans rhizosphaerae]|uniref:amidase domain-containing protein n=1 Tax=Herbihabitans rhizosphaerae TaxID=1872711 RepID=UPI0013EE4D21
MRAGGWEFVYNTNEPKKGWWWADIHPPTWPVSHDWFFFATEHSKRTYLLQYFEDLGGADVVQVDWENANGSATPDGKLDHSMIVTRYDGPKLDSIYLSYHTTDRLDYRLSELLAQVPPDPARANTTGTVHR